MYSTLTIVILSLAQLRQVTPTPDHHTNAEDLQVLCGLMNLAKGSIDTPKVDEIPESELEDIERINISLADPNWRTNIAATPAAKQKKDAGECKEPGEKEVCKAHYRRWEEHNIAVLEDTKGQKFPNIGKDKLESTLGRSIAITVSGLAAKANTVRDTFTAKLAGERTATATNILNLLAKAAYKAETAADAQSKECKIKLGSTRATDCTLPKGATAVCETLLSVCAQDGTQQKEIFGTTASPNGQRGAWGESEKANKWNPIKSVCDAADPPKLTAT
uniref:Variant surface glycoprotein 1125.5609 n=1 Tax=Trypanosoma brucei TaxID=5691 RepID=A0A1J0RD04_9TRYP|nr:variant surface glycoprotein 1125.5609 [Trypanosoma brucei]